MKTCVDDRSEEVNFILRNGLGGVDYTNKNIGKFSNPRISQMKCEQTSTALKAFSETKIDYLSLDVEGHELHVLKGIDWNITEIKVITLENNVDESINFLKTKGFKLLNISGKSINKIEEDSVLLHENVEWGAPV